MHKTIQTVGVAACLVLLAVLLVGCTKAPPTGTGPAPAPVRPPRAPGAAGGEPSTLAEAVKAREGLQSYEMTITLPDGEKVTQLAKLEGGEMVRMKIEQEDGWVLVDKTEGVIYAYSSEMEAVMKLPIEGGEGEGTEMPTIDVDSFDTNAAIVGSETLDGVDCWVVDTTAKEQEEEAKVWVSKADGLLRQVQHDDEVMKVEYAKMNAVPDSEFELPKGLEIMDMSEMLEGLGETE